MLGCYDVCAGAMVPVGGTGFADCPRGDVMGCVCGTSGWGGCGPCQLCPY